MILSKQALVGLSVHYYCGPSERDDLFWHGAVWSSDDPKFRGPFAARIVFVHDDGTANLFVDYPGFCAGSGRTGELVERVKCSTPSDKARRWVYRPGA